MLRERKAIISVDGAGDAGLMFLENRCECGWADTFGGQRPEMATDKPSGAVIGGSDGN